MDDEGGEWVFLMTADVARLAGVGPEMVRVWERRGLLTAVRTPGRVRLFPRPAVLAFLAGRAAARQRREEGGA